MRLIPTLILLALLAGPAAARQPSAPGNPPLCAGPGPHAPGLSAAAKIAQGRNHGTRAALVLFARFADTGWGRTPVWVDDLFAADRPGSVAHFYDTMSFARLRLRGEAAGRVYSADGRAATYLADTATDPGDFGRFNAEILARADRDIDFARFDNDGPDGVPNSGDDDGIVDALFVVVQDAPPRFLLGNATGIGHLGLAQDFVSDDAGFGGRPVRVVSYQGSIQQGPNFAEAVGAICHEYGHILGLPDLFNTQFLQSENSTGPQDDSAGIGRWGLMGWGALGWRGDDGPAAFSGWSRARLGWADVVQVGASGELPGLEDVGLRGRLYEIPLSVRESFWLEHRQRSSSYYDRNIPAEGLLIWHVRDVLPQGEEGFRIQVDLECADGLYRDAGYPLGAAPDAVAGGDNLDFWAHDAAYSAAHGGNLGDATDPFDGVRFTAFTPDTNPAARSDDGTRVARVENIRRENGLISARVEVPSHRVDFVRLRYEDGNDGVLVAGEEARLLTRLRNEGGTDVEDVRLVLATDDPFIEITQPETRFGALRAGGRTSGAGVEGFPRFRLKGGFAHPYRAALEVSIFVGAELVARRELVVTGISPLDMVREISVIDSLGNGDGRVQRGEFFRLGLGLDLAAPAHLDVFQIALNALDGRVRTTERIAVRLAFADGLARSVRAPEFLLAADATPGQKLAFEMVASTASGAWRDTLHITVADGPDRTPPRVGSLRVRRADADRRIVLPAAQIEEGGAVALAAVEVHGAADSALVATVPLAAAANGYAGTWAAPAPGAYLLRALVEDAAGNRGRGALAPHSVTATTATKGAWRRVDLPPLQQSSGMWSLTVAPPDPRVLFLSQRAGAWRSRDRGRTWAPLDLMQGMVFNVDAADPDIVYASSPLAGTLKSTDGGQTWARLSDPGLYVYRASARVPGRLYGWRDGTTAISDDGGQTWHAHELSAWIVEHPLHPEVLYGRGTAVFVGDQRLPDALYRSGDAGRTWTEQTQDRPWTAFYPDPKSPLGVFALAERSLYHSADAGASWAMVHEFPGGSFDHYNLEFNAVDPDLVYAVRTSGQTGTGRNSFRSRDGGRTWAPLPLPALAPLFLLPDPQDPRRLYLWQLVGAGEGPVLHYSDDGGESWQGLTTPARPSPAGVIAFDAEGVALVGGRELAQGTWWPRLFHSDDGGESWAVRGDNSTGIDGSVFTGPTVENLLIDPFDANLIIAQADWSWYSSFNGGRSWQALNAAPGFAFNYHIPVLASPTRRGVHYIGGRTLLRSDDALFGGWRERAEGLPSAAAANQVIEPVSALAVDRGGALYAASGERIWRSDDDAMNWRQTGDLTPQPRYMAFHPRRPGELYAASGAGLFRSADGGANWSFLVGVRTQSTQPKPRIRFAPDDPDRFYLVYGPELLETRDGGRSWHPIGDDLAAFPYFNDVAVDPLRPQKLFAATPQGLYCLERDLPTHVAGAAATPPHFALAANYPNPFNPATAIPYQIPVRTRVRLAVYNALGQRVRLLVDGERPPGAHRAHWDGRDERGAAMGTGVYFYRLTANDQAETRRMLLLK